MFINIEFQKLTIMKRLEKPARLCCVGFFAIYKCPSWSSWRRSSSGSLREEAGGPVAGMGQEGRGPGLPRPPGLSGGGVCLESEDM